MGIFDKLGGNKEEKPRTDFSDVRSGSSSTAAEPAAPAPVPDLGRTAGTSGQDQAYTVVAGAASRKSRSATTGMPTSGAAFMRPTATRSRTRT